MCVFNWTLNLATSRRLVTLYLPLVVTRKEHFTNFVSTVFLQAVTAAVGPAKDVFGAGGMEDSGKIIILKEIISKLLVMSSFCFEQN